MLAATPAGAGPAILAAALLGAAGALKLVDPKPAVRALRSVRLPASAGLVRAGSAAEVAIALAALAGSPTAAGLVSASYAAFAGFVVLARRRGGVLASCGCLGRADTRPDGVHLTVDVSAAVASAVAVVWPHGGLPAVVAQQPLAGLPFVAALAVAGYLTWLALTVLPGALERGHP